MNPPSDLSIDEAKRESASSQPPPIVHVLTYCAHPTSAYGSLLVFDTIRTGFPTAPIEVWDNGSCAEVVPQIKAAAQTIGAGFTAMTNRHYADHLRWVLLERPHPEGVPLVLCDPDMMFWEPVEHWDFGPSLMAGRLMPLMQHSGVVAVPRLHPSLLFVPDVHALRRAVAEAAARSFAWDPIGPRTSWVNGQPHFWDTLSDLFNALTARCAAFGETELSAYDHLFFGTHLVLLGALEADGLRNMSIESHRQAATGNAHALRGVWRKQQAFFETAHPGIPKPQPEQIRAGMLDTLGVMSQWTGKSYPEAELQAAIERTARSICLRPRRAEPAHEGAAA
ncbi:MAG TPA: hypothetical protein VMR43_12380 [Variovorax sp.]|nr:hypothetical protein [Variovorax sp.]